MAAASRAALAWKACEGSALRGAQCATMSVPRDWGNAGLDATFELAVARYRSTGTPGQRIGSLFFNPGGPGESGLSVLSYVRSLLPDTIMDRFDLVTWDPRGVGGTTPAIEDCPGTEPDPPLTGPIDWPAVTESMLGALGPALAACWARDKDVAPYVGTWQVVRDLDALRAAVGDAQITLWGMSYGTTIGREYARTFPTRVRALLLDGTIAPDATVYSYAREHIFDESAALARFMGWLGPASRAQYRRVEAVLQDRTIPLQGHELNRWDFYGEVLGSASYQSDWYQIVEFLAAAAGALAASPDERAIARLTATWEALTSPDPLSGRPGRADDEAPTSFSPVMNYINCNDLTGRPTSDELAAIAAQAAAQAGPWGGASALADGTQCAGVPEPAQPLPPVVALRLPNPPMVVNSVADDRTPWQGARETANAFTGARMVSYDGVQHVTWHRVGSACVDNPVNRFMLTGLRPSRDLACSLVPPPAPTS